MVLNPFNLICIIRLVCDSISFNPIIIYDILEALSVESKFSEFINFVFATIQNKWAFVNYYLRLANTL